MRLTPSLRLIDPCFTGIGRGVLPEVPLAALAYVEDMGEPHLRLAPVPSGSDPPTVPSETIRVLLADDHTLMRRSLRNLLDDEKNIEVVAEVSELPRVLQEIRQHHPQVLVLDLGMLAGSSRGLIARMRELAPHAEVVVVSMHRNPAFGEWALSAGALGFVMKDFAEEDLAQAIHEAALGKPYVSSRTRSRPSPAGAPLRSGQLSARELEVLRLIALGYTNVETADKLGVSPRTVETHRARIQSKLELNTRAELVRYALTRDLLSASDDHTVGAGEWAKP